MEEVLQELFSAHFLGHPYCSNGTKIHLDVALIPETVKYWVGVQRGKSYLMGRRCLISLGWQPF